MQGKSKFLYDIEEGLNCKSSSYQNSQNKSRMFS